MTESRDPQEIRSMFNRISPRYDVLNRVLSGFQDQRWRHRAVGLLGDLRGGTVLDLCCGTGDFIGIFQKKYGRDITIYGVDFAFHMLTRSRQRHTGTQQDHILHCQGDAMALPFLAGTFDAVTIGFGIRNVADRLVSLRDIYRILKAGGHLAIIEPSIPQNSLIGKPFSFYFKHIMPTIGGWLSGDRGAYKYLDASVTAFPSPEAFTSLMQQAGFEAVFYPQFGGTAVIYVGRKPQN